MEGLFSEFYGISKVAIAGAAVARERRRISGRRSSLYPKSYFSGGEKRRPEEGLRS